MPLNMASVFVFEGAISADSYKRFIESRLPLIPRFLKRVVPPPFNLGLGTWDYDPSFELRNHVHEATLTHGTEAELKALAGNIFSKTMDRQHPLWDLTLVHGLKGNRTAIIARIHHCLADGIAGVGIINLLADPIPEVRRLTRRKERLRVPSPQNRHYTLGDGAIDAYAQFMDRLFSVWADLLNLAERTVLNGGAPASKELSQFLPEITAPTKRLRFNQIYRGPQKFAWAEIPLADVKMIKQACGTSVNDVLLALVTATMRRYSEFHGDQVKGRTLRMMIPVNVRGDGASGSLGNHISLVPVTVPLGVRDPKKLLDGVHARTEFLKRAHAPELVAFAGGLAGVLPNPVQLFIGQRISRVPFTPFNMVCTNVPGPQTPLYVLGHKMLRWYPYVPIGGELAVNCAILSYDGAVYFGFSGDAHIAPDLARLEKFLKLSFTELRDAVDIKSAHQEKNTTYNKTRRSNPAPAESLLTRSPTTPAITPVPTAAPTPKLTVKGPDIADAKPKAKAAAAHMVA
jgi:WS/DGAT/MGAT family acyltransferase